MISPGGGGGFAIYEQANKVISQDLDYACWVFLKFFLQNNIYINLKSENFATW